MDGQKEVVELQITLRTSDGETIKVQMNKEDQKVFLSLLLNFYKDGIPSN